MKNYRFQSLILFVLLWVMATALFSCGVVNKHLSKEKISTATDQYAQGHSVIDKIADSVNMKAHELSVKTDSSEEKNNGLNIRFYNTDMGHNKLAEAITITWTDSSVSITPGNRAIESIRGNMEKKYTKIIETKQSGKDSVHVVESSHEVVDTSSVKHIIDKKDVFKKNVFRVPSPWWLLLLLIPVAVWKFWPYVKKIIT